MISRTFAALAVTVAFVACSGPAQSIIPGSSSGNVSALYEPADATKGIASVTIAWSKTVAGVVVECLASSGASTMTVANNPGNKPSTTLSLDAPAGSDTFVISSYDRKQKTGEGKPLGNQLGQATVTKTIVAGKVTRVHFTIGGIVTFVSIALPSPGPLVSLSGGVGAQALDVIGGASETVTLTPLDADGNAILTSSASARYTLKPTTGTTGMVKIASISKKPNEFSVSVVPPPANDVSPVKRLELIAGVTDTIGLHTTNVGLIPVNEVVVGYTAGRAPRIAVYDGSGHLVTLPPGAFPGVTQPVGVAYDPDDRWILVADASNKVLAFDMLGNAIANFKAPTLSGLTAIAYYNDKTARVAPGGLKKNPRRVLVADARDGFDELSMSGELLVRAGGVATASGTAYTPTSILGVIDDDGPSTSGALVVTGGTASNSLGEYDMENPNPTHTGVPLSALGTSMQLPQNTPPVSLASVVLGYAGPSSCGSAASPVALVFVTTGTLGIVDYFGAACGDGVYLVSNPVPSTVGSNVTGIAVDTVNAGYLVVDTAANAVDDYSLVTVPPTSIGSGSFDTPMSTGMLNPASIAVAF